MQGQIPCRVYNCQPESCSHAYLWIVLVSRGHHTPHASFQSPDTVMTHGAALELISRSCWV